MAAKMRALIGETRSHHDATAREACAECVVQLANACVFSGARRNSSFTFILSPVAEAARLNAASPAETEVWSKYSAGITVRGAFGGAP